MKKKGFICGPVLYNTSGFVFPKQTEGSTHDSFMAYVLYMHYLHTISRFVQSSWPLSFFFFFSDHTNSSFVPDSHTLCKGRCQGFRIFRLELVDSGVSLFSGFLPKTNATLLKRDSRGTQITPCGPKVYTRVYTMYFPSRIYQNYEQCVSSISCMTWGKI